MAFISNLGIAFKEVVRQHCDRVALYYPASGLRVSYGELNQLAERIAAVLLAKGLRQDQVVAIFHDKSPAAFAAMLACLRLGIIYSNLDPGSPWQRVRKIIDSCQPVLVLNAFEVLPFASELAALSGSSVLHLRDLPQVVMPECPAVQAVCGGAPAYIMFTSGSTGMPKGAVMSHANILWFIQWAQDRFGIDCVDVMTNVNPIYFDNSVFDFYVAIFSGATLVPLVPAEVQDSRLLIRLVEEARCSIWFSVPSLLVYLLTTRALTEKNFPALRKIIFGGEGFPKPKLKQLYDLFGARADLENVYGPTECTCICSARTIEDSDFDDGQGLAALGLLAPNFSYEILPLDSANPNFGELFLCGPQVGLGYYRDEERSRTSFVQSPTHNVYADVGYRTGDLVQRDTRGWLHFKGRVDFQIKHMGYRIELEEVEAAISTLPEVDECAATYQKMGDGIGQILAFVAASRPLQSVAVVERLRTILPAYMVPRRVMVLDFLPKNANGKIDRIALMAASDRKDFS
jgi:D-alanine--poly(phosphoribitol) ligase subunit 1